MRKCIMVVCLAFLVSCSGDGGSAGDVQSFDHLSDYHRLVDSIADSLPNLDLVPGEDVQGEDSAVDTEPEATEVGPDVSEPEIVIPPACPVAPPECGQEGGVGVPIAGTPVDVPAGGLCLEDKDDWVESVEIVDAISSHWSATKVSLDDVLDNLNRDTYELSSLPDVACFHTGFDWNAGDNNVGYWYPQGISGTATAYESGAYNGHKVAIVTWYHKPDQDSGGDQNKGVRVSIADLTDMNDISYRLALLVEPVWSGDTPNYKAVTIHAGGVGWYGDYLYVADTTKGFRIFDLNHILEVQTGQKASLGFVSEDEGYHGHGYRYVIPQVSAYRLCEDSCCARFSFASIDLSTEPPSIIAGEYSSSSIQGRVHRWPLDPDSRRLAVVDGQVTAVEAILAGVKKMQGALTWDGALFVSSSHDLGTLYTGLPGQALVTHSWPYVAEDLHYSPFSDNLYCHTELPGSRHVFTVKKTEILGGCDN
jgi:hypothetical protein